MLFIQNDDDYDTFVSWGGDLDDDQCNTLNR